MKKNRSFPLLMRAAAASALAIISSGLVQASDWTGTGNTVNWSTVYDGVTFTTGWISSVPNGAGTAANFYTNGNSRSVVLDTAVTVGSLTYSGASGGTRTITMSNPLTLDNNGLGAVIANNSTATSSILSFSSGTFNVADNVRIVNSNTALNGSNNGITFGGSTVFQGSGNLTFSNAANTTNVAAINWGGTHTFTGSVLIEKGAVIFGSAGNAFGNISNTITLGSSGNGSATMLGTASGSASDLKNNIVVAAGTTGTLLLGNNGTGTVNATFSGAITLNGNVSLTSARPSGNDVRYTNVISGAGGVTTVGTGETQYGNGTASVTNTYHGNTVLAETSSLVLSDNAKMTFYIEGSGVNNKITGINNNALTLDGDFVFDLSAASATVGASWSIVDVSLLNTDFRSTFTVVDFLADGGGVLWTKDINGTSFYQFSEATGVLSVVPEPGACALAGLGLTMLLFRCRRP